MYNSGGAARVRQPLSYMFWKSVAAGGIIALGGAVTNTASHSLGNVSAVRVVSGLLFPFGLFMVILLGMELFTGNILLSIPLLHKRISWGELLKNLGVVYLGNMAGGLLVAAGCVYGGQLNYSGGELAVFTIRLAASKCALPPGQALILAIFCNVLVCAGVLLALCADDVPGKFLGGYAPVAFFVICGFEHCVANMFYIPAGLLALGNPEYARLAAQAGVQTGLLSWGRYLAGNLLPVTAGNIIGGLLPGLYMWFHYREN